MSGDFLDRISKLSPKRLALLALEQHEKLEARSEPIAIVGLGCRFPGGADDPDTFWQLLAAGRDAIRDVPAERWDIGEWYDPDADAPARMSVRNGGFLDRIDGFDAAFFGISPREALTMDPQQRLVLEVAWEALEHAGIAPARLAGSATGVFIGVCNSDHFQRSIDRGAESIDAYLASGNAHSVVSGRIAYFLGLHGPALSIDTACSSSLVALHVAVQSLRAGEVRAALAGGVNIMCSPQTTIALTKAHMLAPDGRCKTFDAAADGFARGEGCGLLVLKRLSDAQADGDRVLALIRGSASNQDGRSGGLTVPSGPAQEAVIRAALADARLEPADIGYVEAHGTGTTLGDPIEIRALGAALSPGRAADAPLLVGSVKTNIGHLESAAGVAGVIKVVLSLLHERIPPHPHFRQPSPHIDWQRHPVQVKAEGCTWERGVLSRRAGISSFGFSGTNAHVVLEEAPARPAAGAHDAGDTSAASGVGVIRPLHLLPLSARSPSALRLLAERFVHRLEAADAAEFAAVTHSAGIGRSHFAERLAVVAADAPQARAALSAFLRGDAHEALHIGTSQPGQATEFAFMFTGQGSQYPGMGTRLGALAPAFAEVIDCCDRLLGADAKGRTLQDVLHEPAGAEPGRAAIHETAWTQPALFALELALTEQWRRWGVPAAAVIGHSAGEYPAACAAGVFTLEEGLALIAERGRLMQSLRGNGAMASLNASAAEVEQAVAASAGRVCIAAVNAPDNLVVAGEAVAVDALLAQLATRDVMGQKLHVALAAHSPLVEPALAGLEAAACRVPMRPPTLPVAWNVGGGTLPATERTQAGAPEARYWCRQLREPVRFAEGVAWLHDQGFSHFIEVGPHPTLAALAERGLPQGSVHCIGSLRRGRDDWTELMHALARAYVCGADVDWAEVNRPFGAARTELPTYPFERRSFWIDTAPPAQRRSPEAAAAGAPASTDADAPIAASGQPLAARQLSTAVPTFELHLRPDAPDWLGEHRVMGEPLVAGPVYIELIAATARALWGAPPRAVMGMELHAPLVLPDEGRVVQWHFTPAGAEGEHHFRLHSRGVTSAVTAAHEWTCHATGQVRMPGAKSSGGVDAAGPPIALAQLAKDLGAPASCAPYYERLRRFGIDLGPVFASLQQAHGRDGTVLARLQLADSALHDPVTLAHPGLLDGALQAVGLALPVAASGTASAAGGSAYLLSGVQELVLRRCPLPPTLWCLARLRPSDSAEPAQWQADVTLHDDAGVCVGRIGGVSLRRAAVESLQRIVAAAMARPASDGPALPQATDVPASLAYEMSWEPCVAMSRAARLLAAPSVDAAALRARFEALAAEHDLAVYDALLPELDALSAAHVAQALIELGFDSRPGRRFAVSTEASALGVAAPRRKLFTRMLEMLAEDGVLVADGAVPGAAYECRRALQTPPPAQLVARHQALAARFAPVDGELSTLHRCGAQLARVLCGEQDPLQLLFPGGSFAEARKLYLESPYARAYNGTLAAALQAAVGRLPAHARLRVLEIGAGTGGTTARVLPILPAERAEYIFTDLSPLFLERAAEQFRAFPFVQQRLLDIERDPMTQGFATAHYDIVIAANVLHATADLGRALAHARALLAPGGQLLLLEGTAPQRWVDLTFGLTEGWWRFTDGALRPDYPLISRQAWRGLLARSGFDEIGLLPGADPVRPNASRRAQDQQVLIVARAAAPPRRWQLVGGPPALVAALEDRLLARGDRVARLAAGSGDELGGDAARADGAEGAVEWVYLGALELAALPSDAKDGPARCESLAVQQPLDGLARLARRPATAPPARAWLVTQGAQRLPGDDAAPSGRWMAPLAGLGRVFALEHPARWGGLVDLPSAADVPSLVEWLLRSFDRDDDEDQIAWRGGSRHVARLMATPPAAAAAARAPQQALALRADATYLVTGAFGGLGGPIATWLVDQGAEHIALVGRRPDAAAPLVRALRERGAQVVVLAGDIGDEAFVAALPRRLAEAEAPALAGIFHLAADLSHAAIDSLNHAQVGAMLRPKIGGTLALERLARAQQLDWLVLFSTTTALLGAAGLAHYAAANAFLDAAAESAGGERPKVVSINWGTWEAMRLASAADQQDFREAGLLPMRTADALDAMARLLASGRSRGVIANADWARLKAVHEARRARPLLRRLGAEPVASAALPGPAASGRNTAGPAAQTLARRLAAAPAAARHDVLVDFVQSEVAAVLALPDAGAIALGTGLFDMGMDSLMAVELKRRLERAAGQPLPSTLTFNYPNVGALVGFLQTLLAPREAPKSSASEAAAAAQAANPASAADTIDADLDALSDAELEARLLATLEKAR